jgi:hypothetical protein
MDSPSASQARCKPRLVVVGRNSQLWSRISERLLASSREIVTVGHAETGELDIQPNDVVWIFSYAKSVDANRFMFNRLARSGTGIFIYLSSATANIGNSQQCYRYPYVKRMAELDAAQILSATIVRIGLIHDDPEELPAGVSAATQLDRLVEHMLSSSATAQTGAHIINLFELVKRPFGSRLEQAIFHTYGALLTGVKFWPCILRPIDLLLRAVGWRWYGYFRMSNDLWSTTIS